MKTRGTSRWRDRKAGVALMFALSAIPIIGLFGLAIDLGYATQARATMNTAADAAALAAAKSAADAFTANKLNYLAIGNAAGLEWFKSQADSVQGATTSAGSPAISVVQSGAVFTSTVSYKGTVKPFIAPMFGISSLALGGTSSATVTAVAYTSVTFLLDNSSSMLIASTQAGVDTLNSITPNWPNKSSVPSGLGGYHCAFACHWDANNNDYYGLARANNIPLRFDVVQTATAASINQMISQETFPDQYSVGIYTFTTVLKQIYPASTATTTSNDLASAISAAKAIQTPVLPGAVGNTDFSTIMKSLVNVSSQAGDGSSALKPRKALIIVTDGIIDLGSRTIPSSKGPILPTDCAAMKNLGFNLFVLYTTYITTPPDLLLQFGNDLLLPYINGTTSKGLVPSLQSCASTPTNYAEASDPVAINTAMTTMLKAALASGGRFLK
jgi:Flp pilus assembly protein TadG